MKIIDAHMHPFTTEKENIKLYEKKSKDFSTVRHDMVRAGISFFCGSVITKGNDNQKESLVNSNESAFRMYNEYPDFYLPGVVVHPEYKDISCEYIKKAYELGFRLVGELTPYNYGWKNYMDAYEIFEYAESLGMTLSCHTTKDEDMRALAKSFRKTEIVYAHPGEKPTVLEHISRIKDFDNVYLDLSGTGVMRYGVVRELINSVGKERILFGTDYPVCNPAMYVSAVLYENLTDDELEHIFYKNAERVYKHTFTVCDVKA